MNLSKHHLLITIVLQLGDPATIVSPHLVVNPNSGQSRFVPSIYRSIQLTSCYHVPLSGMLLVVSAEYYLETITNMLKQT